MKKDGVTEDIREGLDKLAGKKQKEMENCLRLLEQEILENKCLLQEKKQLLDETGKLEKEFQSIEDEQKVLALENAGLLAEQKQARDRIKNLREQIDRKERRRDISAEGSVDPGKSGAAWSR